MTVYEQVKAIEDMTLIRVIRVRSENGERLAAALRAAGFEAVWLGPGTAFTNWHNGCGDPGCCPQHHAHREPHRWGCIRTNASGSQAHRVWVSAGLVQCRGCKSCRRAR